MLLSVYGVGRLTSEGHDKQRAGPADDLGLHAMQHTGWVQEPCLDILVEYSHNCLQKSRELLVPCTQRWRHIGRTDAERLEEAGDTHAMLIQFRFPVQPCQKLSALLLSQSSLAGLGHERQWQSTAPCLRAPAGG